MRNLPIKYGNFLVKPLFIYMIATNFQFKATVVLSFNLLILTAAGRQITIGNPPQKFINCWWKHSSVIDRPPYYETTKISFDQTPRNLMPANIILNAI